MNIFLRSTVALASKIRPSGEDAKDALRNRFAGGNSVTSSLPDEKGQEKKALLILMLQMGEGETTSLQTMITFILGPLFFLSPLCLYYWLLPGKGEFTVMWLLTNKYLTVYAVYEFLYEIINCAVLLEKTLSVTTRFEQKTVVKKNSGDGEYAKRIWFYEKSDTGVHSLKNEIWTHTDVCYQDEQQR